MKYEMKDKWKNSLMKRDEVLVSIEHSGEATPNRKEVMGEVAKLLKTKPENLIVTRISTPGGSTITEVKIYSYFRKEDIPEWKVKKFNERIAKIKGPAPPPEKPPEAVKLDSAPEDEPKEDAKPAESEAVPEGEKPDEVPKPTEEEPKKEEIKPSEAPAKEKPAEAPVEETKSSEAEAEEKPEGDTRPEDKPSEGDTRPEDKKDKPSKEDRKE